jgi:hypothetical protein
VRLGRPDAVRVSADRGSGPGCKHRDVTVPQAPTTPQERRAATSAWRALPYPVRRQVAAAARRGRVAQDQVATETGRQWAATMLRPRGPHWWRRHPQQDWLRLALAAGLVAETIWLVSSGRLPWSTAWPLPALAYLLVLISLFNLGLRRNLRRLVAAPAGPTVPELSAEPRS